MSYQFKIEKMPGYVHFKLTGQFSLNQLKIGNPKVLTDACNQNKCRKLLVDIRQLSGAEGVIERFESGKFLANNLGHTYRVAILGTPHQMMGDSFFETVTTNRGGNTKVFYDQKEAVNWLHRQP